MARRKNRQPIQSVAEGLPPEERDKFQAIVQRIDDLPEEDEIYQIFQAFGCLAESVKKVPDEVSELLKNARSGLTDEQRDGLRDDMEAMFKKSIDTPSYKDLRELVRLMQVAHGKITREVQNLAEPLHRAGRPHKMIVFSTVSGLLLGLINALLMAFILTDKIDLTPLAERPKSPMEWKGGRISYREMDDPEFGRIGVVRVVGEIVAAREGDPTDRAYIFVRPIRD
jgi:hypothetical protein